MPSSPATPNDPDVASVVEPLSVGQHVVITQQIPQRDEVWTTRVAGEVVRYEQKKTGSWFAHAKDDRLWLDRLTIRKIDGELVTFVLDRYTRVHADASQVASSDTPQDSAATS